MWHAWLPCCQASPSAPSWFPQQHVALAGSHTHGWCSSAAWLASMQPGHLDFASMFCYEPGKQASSSSSNCLHQCHGPCSSQGRQVFLFFFFFFPTLIPSLAPWLNYRNLGEDHAVGRRRGEEALSGNGGAKSVLGWSLHLQSCQPARKGGSYRPISWVLGLLGCGSYKAFSGASVSSSVDLLWTELCASALLPPNSDAEVLTPSTMEYNCIWRQSLKEGKVKSYRWALIRCEWWSSKKGSEKGSSEELSLTDPWVLDLQNCERTDVCCLTVCSTVMAMLASD